MLEGPIDIDSLEFQTRCQIRYIAELTGESRGQVVTRAVEALYRLEMAKAADEMFAALGLRGNGDDTSPATR